VFLQKQLIIVKYLLPKNKSMLNEEQKDERIATQQCLIGVLKLVPKKLKETGV
jgi:2-hydroxy-3-keto-5-methylthiopentenyl-1-phosphate phosphatase